MSKTDKLPRAAQIAENPDLFEHLAKANQELGNAAVELILENRQLCREVSKLKAQLAMKQPKQPPPGRLHSEQSGKHWAACWAGSPVVRVAHMATEDGAIAIKPENMPGSSPGGQGSPTVLILGDDVDKLAGILEMALTARGYPTDSVIVTEDDGDPG